MCTDPSLTFLNDLGYNVVRLPKEGIAPLDLLGKDGQGLRRLGSLGELWLGEGAPLPGLRNDLAAASISGKRSSKFNLSLGVSLLERLIGAMGGNAELTATYSSASTLEFVYEDVLGSDVSAAAVGNYLVQGKLVRQNPLLEKYLFGEAEDMFILTATIRSRKFSVVAYDQNGAKVKISVPAIKGVVQGNIEVGGDSESTTKVTYAGPKELIFGFQCFHLYLHDGKLALGGGEVSGGMALSMLRPLKLGGKGATKKPDVKPLLLQEGRLIRVSLKGSH